MDYLKDILTQIELHSVDGIKKCFENGISPNHVYNDKPLIDQLTSEYARSSRFRDCVKAFVDFGLQFANEPLLAVLLDDSTLLEKLITGHPEIVRNRYTLRCAYTPLINVTLLHICAEFNHLACAEILLNYGADVNAKAGTDEDGFGGQTPIFHTVNQNHNQSKELLDFLLINSADLTYTVRGIVWGKGYEWETLIPAVNPISYAMMGLLPQMHRNETTISETVALLLHKAYNITYPFKNIPNKYLKSLSVL